VAGQPVAWRILGLLPVLSTAANACMSQKQRSLRRLNLFHKCLAILVEKINAFCSEDQTLVWADNKARVTRAFMHFLLTDGLEASVNSLCPTTNCLSCWCPADRLDDTEVKLSSHDIVMTS
jgi:hypothetical protein